MALMISSMGTASATDCKNAVTQADLNNCEGEAFTEADGRLNRTYARVIRNLEPERAEALRIAQRAWVAFRERECAFAGSAAEGGSMQPMLISGCSIALTEERIKGLEGYLR